MKHKVNLKGLDRNFALDRKVKALKVKVKRDPAFAKLVKSEVKLALDKAIPKATVTKQAVIDTQAKRISDLTLQVDAGVQELVSLRKFSEYVDGFLSKWMSITSNTFLIARVVAFLIGFIWITWLLVTHFR